MVRSSEHELLTAIRSIEQEFLGYQLRYIYDKTKFRIVRKPVRCGFTYAHSWWSMKRRMLPRPGGPIREIFVSKNLKTAAEYMSYLRKWGMGLEKLLPKGTINLDTWTAENARLPGGNIEIFSSDPDGFRGVEGDVTLDEIDFHDQQAALYGTSQSRADWIPEGQISLFSSRSYNPATWFAQFSEDLFNNPQPNFSLYALNLDDCVKDGLAFKQPGEHLRLLDGTEDGKKKCIEAFYAFHRNKCPSEEDYRREYFWEATGQSQLVSPKAYDACTLAGYTVPDALDDVYVGDLYVGVDCGRSKDLTAAWVLQQQHDAKGASCYRTVCLRTIRNMAFPDQHRLIAPIVTHPRISKGFIDQGAQGRALADSVADVTGSVVQPFGFSAPRKMDMAERVRAFVQSQRVSLPNDPLVKADITSMMRKVTEKNQLKYEGQTRDSHGDRFWALALALEAAEGEMVSPLSMDHGVLEAA